MVLRTAKVRNNERQGTLGEFLLNAASEVLLERYPLSTFLPPVKQLVRNGGRGKTFGKNLWTSTGNGVLAL